MNYDTHRCLSIVEMRSLRDSIVEKKANLRAVPISEEYLKEIDTLLDELCLEIDKKMGF